MLFLVWLPDEKKKKKKKKKKKQRRSFKEAQERSVALGLLIPPPPPPRVNDELCDFPGLIDPSKSSLQILWLLPENTHLETKRSNEGKPESERARRGSASRASEDSDLPIYLAG
jgi:hypothetical protein